MSEVYFELISFAWFQQSRRSY